MNQNTEIFEFMRRNGSITTMQAFELGITRLASRIHDLRESGCEIISESITAKNRHGKTVHFSRYRLNGSEG